MKKDKKLKVAKSTETVDAKSVRIKIDGKKRTFNIDNPQLPDWVEQNALASGGYPYKDKLNRNDY